MNKPPILPAIPREDFYQGNQIYCVFCKAWHRHGQGNGHRVTHCTVSRNTPHYDHGYYIHRIEVKPSNIKTVKPFLQKLMESFPNGVYGEELE